MTHSPVDQPHQIRVALIQTCNAYKAMPAAVAELDALDGQLDALRQANLDHHEDLIRKAHAQGAQVFGLGELFAGPYFALYESPMWRALAEDATTGPSVLAMRSLAAELGVVIIAPIYEVEDGIGHRYNTAVVIDADGQVAGHYRKTHIPNGTNERASFWEAFYYDASRGLPTQCASGKHGDNPYFPVFDTHFGRLGVAICYDRHFDGAMQSLARAGAQLIVCPAVTFGAKSERMWEQEFEVDACRYNVFIAGLNRLGSEPPWNVPYFGRSYVTGPDGRCTNLSTHPNLVIADCALDTLATIDPSGWALQRDVRNAIYTPRAPKTRGDTPS